MSGMPTPLVLESLWSTAALGAQMPARWLNQWTAAVQVCTVLLFLSNTQAKDNNYEWLNQSKALVRVPTVARILTHTQYMAAAQVRAVLNLFMLAHEQHTCTRARACANMSKCAHVCA